VLPALVRKFAEAKRAGAPSVELWGTGTPRREFLWADDLARACVTLLEKYDDPAPINIGVGEDLTIAELAQLIARVVGYEGDLTFDPSRPDGTPRKLLDVSRIHALGWKAEVSLPDGIERIYRWFDANET
jgi:GDP-L-fucose synthase